MNKINIGIIDYEEEYVSALSVYLQRYGKGKWNLFGFTESEMLKTYLAECTMDLLIGTSQAELVAFCEEYEVTGLLLNDTFALSENVDNNIYVTKRFQSAKDIGKMIDEIIRNMNQDGMEEKMCIAVYSPVGRCGKTSLALDIANNNQYGRWMYIGLEDYGSLEQTQEDTRTDEAIYYWKEKKTDAFLEIVEDLGDVLGTGLSLFDRKQIDVEDYCWLKEQLWKSAYKGIIFDVGSGVMDSPDVFYVFDRIIVPYIEEAYSLQKMNRFETMLKQHGMESILRRCHFVCMDNLDEVVSIKEMIVKGGVW